MLGKALQLAAAGNVSTGTEITWPDVSTATHVRFDKIVSSGDFRGIFFKPDGTAVYVCDQYDNIREATLSTAWDISTHSASGTGYMRTDQTHHSNPRGIFFKDDGTELYGIQDNGSLSNVIQYSLSTAWDLSTASYTRKVSTLLGSANESGPKGVSLSPDGTNLYVNGTNLNTITRFTLSTAWDISTASYDSEGSSHNSSPANESSGLGMFMKPDGTRFYVVGNGNDRIFQWNATTAYDVSVIGGSSSSNAYIGGQETLPMSMYISPDGSHMYVGGGAGNGIDQYSLG